MVTLCHTRSINTSLFFFYFDLSGMYVCMFKRIFSAVHLCTLDKNMFNL